MPLVSGRGIPSLDDPPPATDHDPPASWRLVEARTRARRRRPKSAPSDAGEAATIGEVLRAARLRRRIGIDRAADETCIRAGYLMRIESDDLDFLPAVYVRGFLASYAAFLALDPRDVVARFERERKAPEPDEAQLLAQAARRPAAVPRGTKRVTAVVTAGVLLLALAWLGRASDPRATKTDRPIDFAGRAAEDEPEDDARGVAPVAPVERSQPSPATADDIRMKVVASRARCWIEVVADGRAVFARTLELGESAAFRAERDMMVTFGFPAGVEVTVNGENLGFLEGTEVRRVTLPADLETL